MVQHLTVTNWLCFKSSPATKLIIQHYVRMAMSTNICNLSQDIASGSDIAPCNTIDKTTSDLHIS